MSENKNPASGKAGTREQARGMVGLTDAVRGLLRAIDDVEQGRSIHNERKPDDKIEGPVWQELRSASDAARALLATPPATGADDEETLRKALEMARTAMVDNGLTQHGLPRVFETIDAALRAGNQGETK